MLRRKLCVPPAAHIILSCMVLLLLSATLSRSARAAPISPDTLSNLEMWLKADDITGLNSGDPVGTWSDSFGSNDATQSDAAKQPLWIDNELNGLPVVRFDGANDVLNTGALQIGSDTTVFFLTRNSQQYTTGNFHRGILTANNGPYRNTGNGYGFGYQKGTNPGFGISQAEGTGGGSEQRFNNLLAASDAFEMIAYRKSSTNAALYRDNFATPVATSVQIDPVGGYTTGYNIGADISFATREYLGDIAEIIVYNSALSDSELQGVGEYLNDKWFSAPPPPSVPTGLVSYWNFDDGSTATDQISSNDGIAFNNGATFSTDTPATGGANSLDLTNGNGYVTLPPVDYGITNEYTISAWVKRDGNGSGRFFAVKRDLSVGGSDRSGVALGLSGGEVYTGAITGAIGGQTDAGNINGSTFNDITTTSGVEVAPDEWTHVLVTLKDNFITLYVDGVAETVYASDGGPNTGELKSLGTNIDFVDADGSFSGFGADGNAPAHSSSAGDFTRVFFDGLLDEVAVWNVALSPSQIQALAGGASPAQFPVPEPSSIVLLAMGLLGLAVRRRKRV